MWVKTIYGPDRTPKPPERFVVLSVDFCGLMRGSVGQEFGSGANCDTQAGTGFDQSIVSADNGRFETFQRMGWHALRGEPLTGSNQKILA